LHGRSRTGDVHHEIWRALPEYATRHFVQMLERSRGRRHYRILSNSHQLHDGPHVTVCCARLVPDTVVEENAIALLSEAPVYDTTCCAVRRLSVLTTCSFIEALRDDVFD